MQTSIAQRDQVPGWRDRSHCASLQPAMHGRRLGCVFEGMHSRQLSLATQRIGRVAMRTTDADNRLVVPLDYAIEQTHQAGVWNESADFRFVDRPFVFRHLPVTSKPQQRTSTEVTKTAKFPGYRF